MSTDPERPPRPGGRRSSPIPWARVARYGKAAAVAAPALAAVATGRFDQALRVFQAANLSTAVASRRAQRQQQPQADTVDELLGVEDAVLFLREFADDNAPFSQCDDRHDRGSVEARLAFLWRDPDEEFLSFERYVGPEMTRRVGPMIGLGNPTDKLPPEGEVHRHWADDGNWFEKITLMIRQARCIVMLPRVTGALERELGVIADGFADKFFVVTSPYAEPGAAEGEAAPLRLRVGRIAARAGSSSWEAVTGTFGKHGLTLPPDHPGPGCVLGFDRRGRFRVLASGATRASAYVDAIVDGLGPAGRSG